MQSPDTPHSVISVHKTSVNLQTILVELFLLVYGWAYPQINQCLLLIGSNRACLFMAFESTVALKTASQWLKKLMNLQCPQLFVIL